MRRERDLTYVIDEVVVLMELMFLNRQQQMKSNKGFKRFSKEMVVLEMINGGEEFGVDIEFEKKSVADGDNGSEIEVRVESNSKGCCVYG